MKRFDWLSALALLFTLVIIFTSIAMADEAEFGLAQHYAGDDGIRDHPAVIAATGFETPQWAADTFNHTRDLPEGYQHTTDPSIVLHGKGSLQIQQTSGTHQPYEFAPAIPESDVVFVRWYRRYEAGYQWTQHKMPGVYAKASSAQNGSAGVRPTGCDKYSCKLYPTLVPWATPLLLARTRVPETPRTRILQTLHQANPPSDLRAVQAAAVFSTALSMASMRFSKGGWE